MDTKAILRKTLPALLLACCVITAGAQNPADSAAIAGAQWEIIRQQEGLTAKRVSIRLFDSDQQISCVEINPAIYRLQLVQDSMRTKVSRFGRQNNAEAAINGGFFKTGTDRAIANDIIKIDGKSFPTLGGWGNGAFGIDHAGNLHFILRTPGMNQADSAWQAQYDDVLAAGPLLLRGGQPLVGWDPAEARHPRSCIGVRADGTIVLLVVDGRQKKADGMGFCHLAFLARMMGITDMLNLDGGGSSALWLSGRNKINAPSDRILFLRFERPVCNAVIVKRK